MSSCKEYDDLNVSYQVNEALNEYMRYDKTINEVLIGKIPLGLLKHFNFSIKKVNGIWTPESIKEWQNRTNMNLHEKILDLIIAAHSKVYYTFRINASKL